MSFCYNNERLRGFRFRFRFFEETCSKKDLYFDLGSKFPLISPIESGKSKNTLLSRYFTPIKLIRSRLKYIS